MAFCGVSILVFKQLSVFPLQFLLLYCNLLSAMINQCKFTFCAMKITQCMCVEFQLEFQFVCGIHILVNHEIHFTIYFTWKKYIKFYYCLLFIWRPLFQFSIHFFCLSFLFLPSIFPLQTNFKIHSFKNFFFFNRSRHMFSCQYLIICFLFLSISVHIRLKSHSTKNHYLEPKHFFYL